MAQLRRLAYPVILQLMPDTVLVSFPDIPEALTEGNTEHEALAEAADCLIAALGGYVNDGRRIPKSSAGVGPV
ncbi:MAG: type II toxin-antitoxin system HicB family antitoxin, partial [Gemmatimonadetes bacterium]|nr:type II toxin-antitoxin system HicB family antitoxin [Gemmatimonadota bacterium]